MTWLFLTLASSLFGALAKLLQKILITDQQRDPAALAFVFQSLVAGLFLIYTIITQSFELPDLLAIWPHVLVMILLYAIGNILTFRAFQLAEASEVAVLFATSSIWAVAAAMILLGEQIDLKQMSGIILIIIGVAVTSLRGAKWRLNRGHTYGLLAAMCFGIAFTNDTFIIRSYQSVSSYLVIAFGLPSLAVLALSRHSIKEVPVFLTKKVLPKLLLCAILYALSAITIFTAYKIGGPASLISPINQSTMIFTVALSYWLLGEKDRPVQKIWGTLVTFVGVLLML